MPVKLSLFAIKHHDFGRSVVATAIAAVLLPQFSSAAPVAVISNFQTIDAAAVRERSFSPNGSGFVAKQPGLYAAELNAGGMVRLKTGHDGIGVKLQAAGFGAQRMHLKSPQVHLLQDNGNWPQVDYRREGITETYVNGSGGLHHSFMINSAGPGRPWVRLQLSGGIQVRSLSDRAVEVKAGLRRFTYAGLEAWDSTGRNLPARMEASNNQISITVDDAGAKYPITIDPSWDQQQRFTGSDAVSGDRFGFSSAMSGSTAIIGASLKSSQAGAAYVFTQSAGSWTEQQKLVAADPAGGDLFGASVAVSGNTAVIGAYGKSSSQGAIYVFERNGSVWSQTQKLIADDGTAGDRFGFSVAISGDVIVAGAYQKSGSKGAAYVFTRTSGVWSQAQTLTADDGQASDLFGYSVAVDGPQIAVGATGRTGSRGSVYAFNLSGGAWTQSQVITASDSAANDNLGRSVAISGSRLLAGAFGKNSSQGAAYVFSRSGIVWDSEAKLVAGDAATGDQFGSSVGLLDTTAIVAAPGCDPDGKTNAGAAYIYSLSAGSWSQSKKLVASDAAISDGFGASVAVSAAGALATSWRQTASQGAAYAFGAPVESGISVTYPAMTLYSGVPGVYGGRSSTGLVTSTSPAPAGGLSVTLTPSIPEVTVPASATIPAGQTTVEFPVSAARVASDTLASVLAVAGADSANGSFTVLANKVSVVRFAKPEVNRRGTVLLAVSLVSPALADFTVGLTSSDPLRLTVPAQVTIPRDQSTVKVEVTAGDVDSDTPIKVVATPSNSEKSASIVVKANTDIASLSLQSSRIGVGRATTGTVRLTGPAMPGGEDVVVECNTAEVSVPDTVHVPAGQTSATFRVESQGISACTAKIEASVNNNATAKVLTVVRPKLDSLTVSPETVKGGVASEVTLYLLADAPPEGVLIRLASSNSSVASVPSTVVIPEGARSVTVKITTYRWSNATPKSVKLTAAIPGDSAKVGFVNVTR